MRATLALDRTEEELVTALEAIRDRPDSTAAYRALGDRALTVVGDHDPFVPVEDARRFEPDAVVLSACGHLAEPRASRGVRPRPRRGGGAVDVERDEVARRLGEEGFVVLDVRSAGEYRGETTAPCDPRPAGSPARSTSTCRCCSR